MKVVAFNGSPRKDGNTYILIKHFFKELERHSIETELGEFSEKELRGCLCHNLYRATPPVREEVVSS